MSQRVSSILILLGGLLAVLLLWYLSYLFVRWDTRRKALAPLKRKVWIAVTIGLPLFGFALYLFVQVLGRYLSPQPLPSDSVLQPTAFDPALIPHSAPSDAADRWTQSRGSTEPKDGTAPSRANGRPHNGRIQPNGTLWSEPGESGAQIYETPATLVAPQQRIKSRYALVALDGPAQGQVFPLSPLPLRIGRGPGAGLALDKDLNVSRAHAEIYEWNGALRIRDLGSMHGTQINGIPITDQALNPGDRVAVGGSVLILRELP